MKEKRKTVKTILIITIALMLIVSLFAFVGCTDYGYIFYFSVEEGEGELTMPPDSAPTIHECKDQENMYEVYLRGGKKGYRELTFIRNCKKAMMDLMKLECVNSVGFVPYPND